MSTKRKTPKMVNTLKDVADAVEGKIPKTHCFLLLVTPKKGVPDDGMWHGYASSMDRQAAMSLILSFMLMTAKSKDWYQTHSEGADTEPKE